MAARASSSTSSSDVATRVAGVLAWLSRRGRKANVEGMARYGIVSTRAFGVSMATMRPLVRRLGRDHALAEALWASGWLEARVAAGFIADPAACSVSLMNRWVRDFDNWAVTDSTCLHLFCYAQEAWSRVGAWRARRREYERRAAFALLAALAIHAPPGDDPRCAEALAWLEEAADDERAYVKKAVNWALRQIGKRNEALRHASLACAARIAARATPAARWIASDARRELTAPATIARMHARAARGAREHSRRPRR